MGTYSTSLELKSLPDDIRIIPIDFRVTEGATLLIIIKYFYGIKFWSNTTFYQFFIKGAVSEASLAYLTFSSGVFDRIVQSIPIVKFIFMYTKEKFI